MVSIVRYGIAIDLRKCFGCQTCVAACKVANNLPKDIAYGRVDTVGGSSRDTASGEFPFSRIYYNPFSCQHCEKPACKSACPTGATQIRNDGIVWIEEELCIGCKSCIETCPYFGARCLIPGDVSYYIDVVVGEADAPKHNPGTVEKCTFCYNLIDRGEVPACMQLCPGRARFWGDLDDPDSEVSKAIEGRECEFLHEDAGTKPKVYYLR